MKRKKPYLPEEIINRPTSFKVPEGYFGELNNRILSQLPNETVANERGRTNRYAKLMPFFYMAALFAGAFLIIKVAVEPSKETMTTTQNKVEKSTSPDSFSEKDYIVSTMDDYSLFQAYCEGSVN